MYKIFASIILLLGVVYVLAFGQQTSSACILTGYILAGLAYFYLVSNQKLSLAQLFVLGLSARLLCLGFEPLLSDDYFRFYWDARLTDLGFDVYRYSPSEWLSTFDDVQLSMIYPHLNSPNYYSVYPPVSQHFFSLTYYLSGKEIGYFVLVMKGIIIIIEIISFALLYNLIKTIKLAPHKMGLYWLHPLVVIELCGNVHTESIAIMFILLGLYGLQKIHAWFPISLAAAVWVKLHPILIFPMVFKYLKREKRLMFVVLSVISLIVLAYPLNTSYAHLLESVFLYVNNFEFNGLIYTLSRNVGTAILGYNPIHILGPTLLGIFILIYSYLLLRTTARSVGQISEQFTWVLLAYFLLSTTVHPWYLCILLALLPITNQRYLFYWSICIPISYLAYGYPDHELPIWILALEYVFPLLCVLVEENRREIMA